MLASVVFQVAVRALTGLYPCLTQKSLLMVWLALLVEQARRPKLAARIVPGKDMKNTTDHRQGGITWLLTIIGPDFVVASGIMGSGEWINTPVQAAKFGFALLWVALLSCIIKYFL